MEGFHTNNDFETECTMIPESGNSFGLVEIFNFQLLII